MLDGGVQLHITKYLAIYAGWCLTKQQLEF